jgi:hypothetical protein
MRYMLVTELIRDISNAKPPGIVRDYSSATTHVASCFQPSLTNKAYLDLANQIRLFLNADRALGLRTRNTSGASAAHLEPLVVMLTCGPIPPQPITFVKGGTETAVGKACVTSSDANQLHISQLSKRLI